MFGHSKNERELISALRDILLSCRKYAPTLDRSRGESVLRRLGYPLDRNVSAEKALDGIGFAIGENSKTSKSSLELLQEYRAIVAEADSNWLKKAISDGDDIKSNWEDSLNQEDIKNAIKYDPNALNYMQDKQPKDIAQNALPQKDKFFKEAPFNTCEECMGKGCATCYGTGQYAVGINANHYD